MKVDKIFIESLSRFKRRNVVKLSKFNVFIGKDGSWEPKDIPGYERRKD
jgi:hypothetical protein